MAEVAVQAPWFALTADEVRALAPRSTPRKTASVAPAPSSLPARATRVLGRAVVPRTRLAGSATLAAAAAALAPALGITWLTPFALLAVLVLLLRMRADGAR